jgi:uncharacterized membrane protein YebE (DUF533 family)
MEAKLGLDVFLALAAVGWADGDLGAEEAEGIVASAREAGLGPEELERLEQAVRNRQELVGIDTRKLSREDRVFVYATAVWLCRLDGVVDPAERETLHKLGNRLGLSDGARTQASAAAFEVAQLPSGDRPGKFDLLRLRERIAERLASAR